MILTNCRLIPELCEGFAEEMADIRVEGNTIAEILPPGGNYTGEEVIDCAGRTVMPGLFNIHVHLWFDDISYMMKTVADHTEYRHVSDSMRYMYRLLAYGYTSIRDAGCALNVGVKLRNDINSGKLIGPDIKTPGLILNPDFIFVDNTHSDKYGMPVNDPYAARAAVRKLLREGNDFIKIYGCAADNAGRRGGKPLFFPDEMKEIADTVKWEGTYFAVHSASEEANACAIEYEAHSIEHALWWSQENMDQLIAHGYKSTIVPTTKPVSAPLPGYGPECLKGLRMIYDDGKALIGFGTDATETFFIEEPAGEYRVREDIVGFSRMDILKQATINSAKIIGTDDLRGSIKVGKRADFVVIDGKPEDDLSVFNAPPVYVFKDGEIVAQNGFVAFNKGIIC